MNPTPQFSEAEDGSLVLEFEEFQGIPVNDVFPGAPINLEALQSDEPALIRLYTNEAGTSLSRFVQGESFWLVAEVRLPAIRTTITSVPDPEDPEHIIETVERVHLSESDVTITTFPLRNA